MRYNLIQITDSKQRSFQLEIWTPSAATRLKSLWKGKQAAMEGDWRSLDKGYIRHASGDAQRGYREETTFSTNRPVPFLDSTDADLYLGESGAFNKQHSG